MFWNSNLHKAKDVKNGRANPSGIIFLYLAEDEKTAIYEVRPFISQDVSVAQFELTKDLKIFDFCKYVVKEDEPKNSLLLPMLSVLFSEVTHENEMDYLPSQYFCRTYLSPVQNTQHNMQIKPASISFS